MALLDQWELAREKDPQWLTLYLPESERELTDEAGGPRGDQRRPDPGLRAACATSTR